MSKVFKYMAFTWITFIVSMLMLLTSNASEHVDLSEEDTYLLCKMAMAEAEGEDIDGKVLVINTILNRVNSNEFPDTIKDVIYQKNQFSPISDGRFDKVEPNEECYDALGLVIFDGQDNSQGALYFESCKGGSDWHNKHLKYLFKHGRHRFYTNK